MKIWYGATQNGLVKRILGYVQDSCRVLENPYKGWYHHLLDNGISRYAITDDSVFATFHGMDHIYLRLAWSYLEPREGEFDWSYIDRVVEKYVPRGYKISFRIICSETGRYPGSVGEQVNDVQYATPGWVEKAGAKGLIDERGESKNRVPAWGDPLYLQKPIVFEPEHYGTVKDKGNWLGKNGSEKISKYACSGAGIMRNAIKVMHATYIGYHGYAEEWLADNRELTKEMANLCGYWYFPFKAEFDSELSEGKNTLYIEWLNKGIAPAYKPFSLLLRHSYTENNQHTDILIEDSGNEKICRKEIIFLNSKWLNPKVKFSCL